MTDSEKERNGILLEQMNIKFDILVEGHQAGRKETKKFADEARERHDGLKKQLSMVAKNLSAQIAGNREAIEKTREAITVVDKKVDRNRKAIDKNRGAIETNREKIEVVDKKVDRNREEIVKNRAAIDKNREKIEAVDNKVDRNWERIDEHDRKMGWFVEKIEDHEQRIPV